MTETLHQTPVIPESRTDQDLSQGQALRALLDEELARRARTAETVLSIGFLPQDAPWFTPDPDQASDLERRMTALGTAAVEEASR